MSDFVQINAYSGVVVDDLYKYAQYTSKSIEELIDQQARGFTSEVIGITPPAGGGVNRSTGKARLSSRIESDIRGILKPVKNAGVGELPSVSASGIVSRQPMRRKGKSVRRRRRVPKVLVSAGDFRRVVSKKRKKIGRLMGGWNAAARGLGVKRVPAWITRHGSSEGFFSKFGSGTRSRIIVENAVGYGNKAQLDRVVAFAVDRQQNKLSKQLPYLSRKYIKASGF